MNKELTPCYKIVRTQKDIFYSVNTSDAQEKDILNRLKDPFSFLLQYQLQEITKPHIELPQAIFVCNQNKDYLRTLVNFYMRDSNKYSKVAVLSGYGYNFRNFSMYDMAFGGKELNSILFYDETFLCDWYLPLEVVKIY